MLKRESEIEATLILGFLKFKKSILSLRKLLVVICSFSSAFRCPLS